MSSQSTLAPTDTDQIKPSGRQWPIKKFNQAAQKAEIPFDLIRLATDAAEKEKIPLWLALQNAFYANNDKGIEGTIPTISLKELLQACQTKKISVLDLPKNFFKTKNINQLLQDAGYPEAEIETALSSLEAPETSPQPSRISGVQACFRRIIERIFTYFFPYSSPDASSESPVNVS